MMDFLKNNGENSFMSSFLHDLRKNVAATKNRNNASGKEHEKRNVRPPRTDNTSEISDLNISKITGVLEAVFGLLEEHLDFQAQRLEEEKKRNDILESIAESLHFMVSSGDLTSADISAPQVSQAVPLQDSVAVQEAAGTQNEELLKTSKKYVKDIIEKQRRNDMTYEEIAAYLHEKNIPTFSGRGRWHAQTIHRLLREK